MIPDLARVFVASGSPISVEDILANTLIVAATPAQEKEFYDQQTAPSSGSDHPTIQQLLKDYPHLGLKDIPGVAITYLPNDNYKSDTFGQVLGRKVFLFLSAINRPPGEGDYRGIPKRQPTKFAKLGEGTCDPATTAEDFVSTAWHEFFHLEEELQGSRGFIPSHAGGLDEYVVQYLTTQLSLAQGIPAVSAYRVGPLDAANFHEILLQSGISDPGLRQMHIQGQFNDFLTKVGKGAINVPPEFQPDPKGFSEGLFADVADYESTEPWEAGFKPYFPQIDLSQYEYFDLPEARATCVPIYRSPTKYP